MHTHTLINATFKINRILIVGVFIHYFIKKSITVHIVQSLEQVCKENLVALLLLQDFFNLLLHSFKEGPSRELNKLVPSEIMVEYLLKIVICMQYKHFVSIAVLLRKEI